MTEKWESVKSYEGLYEISSRGRVRSLYSGRILKPKKTRNGYLYVFAYKNKKPRALSIHRAVAIAFVPGDHGLHVNHKNFLRSDNRAENLEWCTPKQNTAHSAEHIKRGTAHGNSLLSDRAIEEIRKRLSQGEVQRRIAEDFGISYSTITKIKKGYAWRHICSSR